MADAPKMDSWFGKVQKYVSLKIGSFVAFIFLVFAAGSFVSLIVIQRWPEMAWLTIVIPLIAGIIAYYDRTVATILFVLFILFFFII